MLDCSSAANLGSRCEMGRATINNISTPPYLGADIIWTPDPQRTRCCVGHLERRHAVPDAGLKGTMFGHLEILLHLDCTDSAFLFCVRESTRKPRFQQHEISPVPTGPSIRRRNPVYISVS